ncbi:type III secretion system export apparatus subunit SctT [Roseiconus lacunae]|uniref:type III secretion system export apparatus subunit SctT n=1 Tax=Roseiconus lacunae TaxID=2605694 RepID=UPI001E2FC213|nr:type III secretion system export apparatus subunit SctT [Roseiconus lacunae]MCD0457853.1 type III secretion system export apparatus subunit SctT [Roseiconus lacunae]
MTELLLDPAKDLFVTCVLCLTRLTAASLVVPFLGGESVQVSVRTSILVALGIMLIPLVGPTVPTEMLSPLPLAGLFLKEAVLGFLVGFVAAKIFWAALGVGMMIDNQRGASIAETLDPSSNSQVSPLGLFLQQSMIALFYCCGGFLIFLTGIFESYVTWPVFSFYPEFSNGFPEFFLDQLDQLMKLILVMASPMLITLFVSEFGLGLINRFAPQLNVFALAMPVKSLVAFIVLVFYLPYLVDFLLTHAYDGASTMKELQTVMQ